MSVTFGTPVVNNMVTGSTTCVFNMTGVTSGQPIFVFVYFWNNVLPTGVADTFSTPYTWTTVESVTPGVGLVLYIGTGGAGTSGTITVTRSTTENMGGVAVSCIGASTASGLSAIDVRGLNSGNSTTAVSPTLTPTASGEGAIMCWAGDTFNPTNPGAPWTATNFSSSGTVTAGIATDPSPTSGSGLSTSWVSGSTGAWNTFGAVVKAASTGTPSDTAQNSGSAAPFITIIGAI